jgi:hypothetical protein
LGASLRRGQGTVCILQGSVITKEVENRVLEESNKKMLVNVHDKGVLALTEYLSLARQDPQCVVQLRRELGETKLRLME